MHVLALVTTFSKRNYRSETFFSSETSVTKRFFSETKLNLQSETKRNEAKLFLWFHETEAKRSETVSVSLSSLRSEIFLKRNWDTLVKTPFIQNNCCIHEQK